MFDKSQHELFQIDLWVSSGTRIQILNTEFYHFDLLTHSRSLAQCRRKAVLYTGLALAATGAVRFALVTDNVSAATELEETGDDSTT
jgi:hypothetical protein